MTLPEPILVTGSSGHLGEALVRHLKTEGRAVRGLDINPSPMTEIVASVSEEVAVRRAMENVKTVFHTATLHKPHVATHSMQDFIDTNVTGTRVLLEAATDAGVKAFIFTSSTSAFGKSLEPSAKSAVWVTESLPSVPKNIYGVTKIAAEGLCRLQHEKRGLNCVILRTSRFFPEDDDNRSLRSRYSSNNSKANELLFRRVDIEDAVIAHVLAANKAQELGCEDFIVSAPTPFKQNDLAALYSDAPAVISSYFPEFTDLYKAENWAMFPRIERVYNSNKAQKLLNWHPKYDFHHVLASLKQKSAFSSPLAQVIGAKGYHDEQFDDGPYPVD